MNHYNGATIWGILESYKKKYDKNDKPYLEAFISCAHAEYGPVRILGKVWGKSLVEDFMSRFKPKDEVRLEGNLQQYDGRNKVVRSVFNFYRFIPNAAPLVERKAAFRLTGEVVSLEGETIKVRIVHKKEDGAIDREETFEVKVPKDALLDCDSSPEAGRLVKLKGYIIQKEDKYGELIGSQQPVVKKLEVINNNGND